jgi:hypothetical protein
MANIAPLRPSATFTDQNGNITKEAYDFLQQLYLVATKTPTASGGHLAGGATLSDVIAKVNLIIDALVAQGVMT